MHSGVLALKGQANWLRTASRPQYPPLPVPVQPQVCLSTVALPVASNGASELIVSVAASLVFKSASRVSSGVRVAAGNLNGSAATRPSSTDCASSASSIYSNEV